MGSPVSVVVAEIVMQNIEEEVLATYRRTIAPQSGTEESALSCYFSPRGSGDHI